MNWRGHEYSVREMSQMTGLSNRHAYEVIRGIADEMHVPYESLLYYPGRGNHEKRTERKPSKMEGDDAVRSKLYKLSVKNLKRMLKQGDTLEEFLRKYKCDETELRTHILKLYGDTTMAERAWEAMMENAKIAETFENAEAGTGADAEAENGVNVEAENDAENDDKIDTETSSTGETAEVGIGEASTLEELNRTLENMLLEKRGLDEKYNEVDVQFKKCCKEHAEIWNEIERLSAELAQKRKMFEDKDKECAFEWFKCGELDRKRAICAEQIHAIRERINELTVVRLMIRADGTVEALNDPDLTLDDNGQEEVYAALMHDAAYEDLRVREIRLLARVVCIARNAERQVEAEFEAEELDAAYKLACGTLAAECQADSSEECREDAATTEEVAPPVAENTANEEVLTA